MSSQTPNVSPPRDHTQYVTSSPDGFLSFGRCGWEGGGGGAGAAVEDGGVRREEGWRISWRCQSERFRVLLWVKSLMRGSEHPASHRSPERRGGGEGKQKEGEGESITFTFITESSWVKHSEVRRMESPEGEGGA